MEVKGKIEEMAEEVGASIDQMGPVVEEEAEAISVKGERMSRRILKPLERNSSAISMRPRGVRSNPDLIWRIP